MNINLKNKNALVCGSSKGIGRAIAIELSKLGANVTLVARSADKLLEVREQLDRSQGQHHDFLVADFSNRADLRRKASALTATKPIHILINNTGGPAGGPILEASEEEFEQTFNNHLICSHLLTRAVVPGMRAEGYGRIVNIISTSVKQPLDGLGVSNTVRAAVANWAKTLANELAPEGITVNNVLPGATATDRLTEIIVAKAAKQGLNEAAVAAAMEQAVPMKRFGQPEEIAQAVAFLVSPAAAYITGINVPVDGGRTKSL
jgi:3-oxoacyl-[acyl-carrier protein] reductase